MATKWRLPDFMTLAIRHHHKPVFSEIETENSRSIAAVVHIADTTACNSGKGPGFPCALIVNESALEITGLKSYEIDDVFNQVEIEIKQVMADWGIK
jgi:HD-like signal output (HDOD) protein